MSQTALCRIAAVALLVGAVLVTASNLLAPQGDARTAVASGMYYPAALVFLLGSLLVMASLPAVYLRQRTESGVLGFVAIVAVVTAGMALTVGWALIQVLIFPWIATMNVANKILNDGLWRSLSSSRSPVSSSRWVESSSESPQSALGFSPVVSASASSYSRRLAYR